MAIYDPTEQFYGRPVANFSKAEGLSDPTGHSYRIYIEYDEMDATVDAAAESGMAGILAKILGKKPAASGSGEPMTFARKFLHLLDDPNSSQLEALLVGSWGDSYENTSALVVDSLVQARSRLPALRALFIGDMTAEECEISWIQQSDISPLYSAFPQLEWLQIRGGEALQLGTLNLPKLRRLVIESGGLGKSVLQSLAQASLPELEHLELWLGTDEYGWDGTVEDVVSMLNGMDFPKLKYLGLRNFVQIDELAPRLLTVPVIGKVETLDLSLGNLSDAGAEALLQLPNGGALKRLDLHHHYLSDAMLDALKKLALDVDLKDRQEPDDWGDGEEHRYIAVSE